MDSRRSFLARTSTATAGSLMAVRAQGSALRVGVIGPGVRGKQHMRQVLAVEGVDLVAVADILALRHAEAREIAPNIRAYFDHCEMLSAEDLDAVVIASPLHLHAQHFIDALEAGAHVYIEKTMAYSLEHAKRMREARDRFSSQVVQVGIQSLSSGAAGDVPLMLADNKVGRITEIRANFYRNSTPEHPPWVRDVPAQTSTVGPRWGAFLGEAPTVEFDPFRLINWRLFWDYSGGAVFELMVHQIGFWTRILGLGIPDQVTSSGGIYLWQDRREVPDGWNVALHFEQPGLIFSWTSSVGNRFFGFSEFALGVAGTIEKIGNDARYIPELVTNPMGQEFVGQSPDGDHMRNFFDAIRSGREPNCPFEIGFQTAVACRMAVDSLRQRRTVRWDRESETIQGVSTLAPDGRLRLPRRARSG